ncbi:MAG TPA: response regulator transcription factor [Frateuria sp.]|uniref:helix-turn-helix transcriptional regulator n=1 Tax=Frateuria sp. TaxID=2211372 RepID=UPI002D7F776D|nr:response regulator transcription factor [Frateuria sp.]HET6804647.1 response regulator transcription factor [Frateuria sp.]
MISIVLGGPDHATRRALVAGFARFPELRVLGDSDAPGHLSMLVAAHRPSVAVLDACWVQAGPLGHLLARHVPPRVMLYADTLARPEILAGVELGVHGCLPRDAPPAAWRRAIQAIHGGDSWIPRALMAAALADLRRMVRSDRSPAPGIGPLTDRQREIVRWVIQGLSNKEIGRRMGISPTTVKTHLHNIFERAGISGRQQLTVHALGHATPARAAAHGAGVN